MDRRRARPSRTTALVALLVTGGVLATSSPSLGATPGGAGPAVGGAAGPAVVAQQADAAAADGGPSAPAVRALEVDGVDAAAARDASALAPTLGEDAAAAAASDEPVDPAELAALGARTFTGAFLVAGVTWDAGQDTVVTDVAVRVREAGRWSSWLELHVVDVDVEGGRPGTEPLVTGGADAAQVRVVTADGSEVEGLQLDVVADPSAGAEHEAPTADVGPITEPTTTPTTTPTPTPTPAPSPTPTAAPVRGSLGDVIRPAIVTRAQWGADERLGGPWPDVSASLRAMYLHHTAGTNTYTRAQAASVVRSIYAFHTKSRDWPDIGYQFLVDRFGTIYQGRRDALVDLPIGAQAGGYNTATIGVSAMGNFQSAAPPAAMLRSIERLFAWQAYAHGLDATGRTTLVTGSSSLNGTRAKPGTTVTVPVILGHRDTNVTACPGARLWAKLPTIRSAVKKQVDAARTRYGAVRPALAAPATVAPSPTQSPVQWSASATYRWAPVPGAVAYQVLTRSSDVADRTDARAWTVHSTVRGTSASVGTTDGRTRVVAVRAVDAQGRRGAVATIAQVTRPLGWQQVRRSGWTASRAGGILAYRSTGTAALSVATAAQVRGVVLDVVRGPSTGSLQVRVGGTLVGTVSTRAAIASPRAVVVVPLAAARTGAVTLTPVRGSGTVTVNAVALPRVPVAGRAIAVGTLVPAPPVRVALTAGQAPVREAVTSTYRWRPVAGATRYEVLVRQSAHGARLPTAWTRVATTTGTSYTLATRQTGRTWVVGVRAVGRGGPGIVTSYPATTRPLAASAVRRSTGWSVRHGDAWYRDMVWQTSARGRTLTVPGARDVRRVRLIVDAAPGRGRVQVLVDGAVVRTVSTARPTRSVHQHVDVVLPRAATGRVQIRTVDARTVRISAVALAR